MSCDRAYANDRIRDRVMSDVLCNLRDWVAVSVGSGVRGEVVGRCSGWVWQHVDTLAMLRICTAMHRDT